MHLFSWNENSQGAKELASALGIKRIKRENSKFRGKPEKAVVNWGSTELPEEILKCRVLNSHTAVQNCSNKLRFFQALTDTDIVVPEWTTEFTKALEWVNEGSLVCARTILNGHSANGLVLMTQDDPRTFVNAPLYTKYVPKKDEFRIHVVGNEVIDVQQKRVRSGHSEENGTPPNYRIRNLENGFIYARENVSVPECALEQARKAVQAISLDFGAVDVIYNEKRSTAYVLEINTAPGLQGTTIENYARAIKELE